MILLQNQSVLLLQLIQLLTLQRLQFSIAFGLPDQKDIELNPHLVHQMILLRNLYFQRLYKLIQKQFSFIDNTLLCLFKLLQLVFNRFKFFFQIYVICFEFSVFLIKTFIAQFLLLALGDLLLEFVQIFIASFISQLPFFLLEILNFVLKKNNPVDVFSQIKGNFCQLFFQVLVDLPQMLGLPTTIFQLFLELKTLNLFFQIIFEFLVQLLSSLSLMVDDNFCRCICSFAFLSTRVLALFNGRQELMRFMLIGCKFVTNIFNEEMPRRRVS